MGDSNWFTKTIKGFEQSAERAQREAEMRRDLRDWDKEFPMMHHELIVRYAAGFLASSLVVSIIDMFRGGRKRRY